MPGEAHAAMQGLDIPPPADGVEAPFYFSTTGATTRRRQTLKHGDTFIVVDSHGDIGASAGGPDGLFRADTRHLSRLELLVNGLQPLLLGSNLRNDNALLSVDLTNPDLFFDTRLVVPRDTVHIVRTLFLRDDLVYQRISLRNYGDRRVAIRLGLLFGSDFADLFEVRGMQRPARGQVSTGLLGSDRAVIAYRGLDAKLRNTMLFFNPAPTELGVGSASYVLELLPRETRSVFVTTQCNTTNDQRPLPFTRGLRETHREFKRAWRGATNVETSNDIFNEVLCRSIADLRMLVTETPQGRYPYAGIPWYSTTFGRDGLITAMQMLWLEPSIALGVVRRLAAYQATEYNPAADAQPGKILHEMRSGEMAALNEVPFGHYYGSVDTTPLFVLLACLYAERTGDDDALRELWPSIEAALAWIDGPGDPDRDGFIEYERATRRGLANQGWKDSEDSVFHADGSLAQGRIALAEVQGYVFAAKRAAARCAPRLGRPELAKRLDQEAEELARRFDDAFWCPEIDSYALALDGEKRPCRVRASNAGQVLFSGIALPKRAAMVAAGLLEPRFFSGWGIRTVASSEPRYNPMSYHNGSIWPHDNALIALGFARYGFKSAIERIFAGLFEAASYMDFRRLPELFCGFPRARNRGPTLYPVACSPQAWASATPFTLIESSLGLEFDPRGGEIRLRNPCLPSFLDSLVLRNLRLGQATVDLKVQRDRGNVSVEVIGSRGSVQVAVLHSR